MRLPTTLRTAAFSPRSIAGRGPAPRRSHPEGGDHRRGGGGPQAGGPPATARLRRDRLPSRPRCDAGKEPGGSWMRSLPATSRSTRLGPHPDEAPPAAAAQGGEERVRHPLRPGRQHRRQWTRWMVRLPGGQIGAQPDGPHRLGRVGATAVRSHLRGLHPGTVATDLSAPFSKSGLSVRPPEEAARDLIGVIDGYRLTTRAGSSITTARLSP